MADVITRLRLESGEFDNKVKRAVSGLLQMEQECRKVGGTLSVLEKGQAEYVRSLGQMETVSRTTRGRINELSSAYTELAMQYKRLTDEEKKGDFGKALNASLGELKTRLSTAKQDLAGVESEMNKTGSGGDALGGVINTLASKFGISTQALGGWGAALAAGTLAVNVAKDAFMNNEEQLDSWGRMVESSQSLYEGFLNSLNTGDISGFIGNINSIINAASAAYDAIDSLNTFNAFNQVNVEHARTAMTESIVDYREGKGKKEEVKAAGEAYKKELEERQKLERESYLAAVAKVASERGVSKEALTKALSGTYGEYEKLKSTPLTGRSVKYSPGTMPGSQGTYTTYNVAANEQEELGQALRQLNDTELQYLQALGAQAERTGNEIAQVDRQLTRVLKGRPGIGGGGGGGVKAGTSQWAQITIDSFSGMSLDRSIKDVQSALSRAQKAYAEAGDEAERAAAMQVVKRHQSELYRIKNEGDVRRGLLAEALAYDFSKSLISGKEGEKEDKKEASMLQELGNISGGISNVVGGLEQLGVDIPEGLSKTIGALQAIISIASGIAVVVTAIEAVSAADMLIPFAHGGVVRAAGGWTVPGHSYNDTVPSLLSSGEVVLNRAQQGNLLSQMESGGKMTDLQPYLDGEMIWLGVNNFLKRSGRGEIMVAKR